MYKCDNSKIFWKELEGEMVLINIQEGTYFTLNQMASLIWRLFIHGSSLEDIAAHIADGYNVERETALKDVNELFRELEQERLVTAS